MSGAAVQTAARALVAALMAALTLPAAHAAEPGHAWRFDVQLDGRPIGTHTFTPGPDGAMRSEAHFTVKLLGFTAYRYDHRADEHWRGDCLDRLDASTDDDGRHTRVRVHTVDGTPTLSAPAGTVPLSGCTMTFAYWNPAMLRQSRLLDPQTGRLEPVRIHDLGPTTRELQGRSVPAHHWRVDGPEQPIELWYSSGGDWLALESTVKGRRLVYLRR